LQESDEKKTHHIADASNLLYVLTRPIDVGLEAYSYREVPNIALYTIELWYASQEEEKHHLKLVVRLTIIPEAHRLLKVRDFLRAFNHGWSLARAMSGCVSSRFAVVLHCHNPSYKEKEIKLTRRTQTR